MAAAAHRGHTASPSAVLAVASALRKYLNISLLLCTVLRQPLLVLELYYWFNSKQLRTSCCYKLLILYCSCILHTCPRHCTTVQT
jgi:hypothetical protein